MGPPADRRSPVARPRQVLARKDRALLNEHTTQTGFLGFTERVGRDAVSVRRELVCENCGYGIRVTVPPLSCPMCEQFEWRPATQAPAAAIHAVSARARIPEAVTVAQLLEVGLA